MKDDTILHKTSKKLLGKKFQNELFKTDDDMVISIGAQAVIIRLRPQVQ